MRRASRIHCVIAVLISPICLLLAASPALAVTTFNDGGVHNIVGASDQLEILDGAGNAPTTVNVLAGAVVGTQTNFSVNARDHSIFTMSGGSLFDELFLFNNASAQLSGGTIGDDLTPADNSSVTVTSVTVNDDLEAHNTSIITINGGSFDEDVETLDSSTITINGGSFQTGMDGASVTADNTSTINIFGGTFGIGHTDSVGAFRAIGSGVINIHGGDIFGQPQGLVADGNGMINVYGLGGQPASINTLGAGMINFWEGPLKNLVAHGPGVKLLGTDGSLASIVAEDSSVIRIYGHSFANFNGMVPLPYGPIGSASGNLTGVLSDGTPIINVPFMRNLLAAGGARGVILLVPEPSAMLLAMLALAGLLVRRRRGVPA